MIFQLWPNSPMRALANQRRHCHKQLSIIPHLFSVLIVFVSLIFFKTVIGIYNFYFCLEFFHMSLFHMTLLHIIYILCMYSFVRYEEVEFFPTFCSYEKDYYKHHWIYWFIFSFWIISMEIWNHYLIEMRKQSTIASLLTILPSHIFWPSLLIF